MGTRHLTAVFVDGEYKVAQYGQWDGYPSVQGTTVLDFLRGVDLKAFADKCRKATWIDPKKLERMWREAGADENGLIEWRKAEDFSKIHPHLSRDTGAKILSLVMNAEDGIELQNSIDFAGESLFCEWAYVVDLDKNVLEVYSGFNKEPLSDNERFKDAPTDNSHRDKDNKFYPVKFIKSYPLDNLPDNDWFVQDCDPDEDE